MLVEKYGVSAGNLIRIYKLSVTKGALKVASKIYSEQQLLMQVKIATI